jgi:hypothetical protein
MRGAPAASERPGQEAGLAPGRGCPCGVHSAGGGAGEERFRGARDGSRRQLHSLLRQVWGRLPLVSGQLSRRSHRSAGSSAALPASATAARTAAAAAAAIACPPAERTATPGGSTRTGRTVPGATLAAGAGDALLLLPPPPPLLLVPVVWLPPLPPLALPGLPPPLLPPLLPLLLPPPLPGLLCAKRLQGRSRGGASAGGAARKASGSPDPVALG